MRSLVVYESSFGNTERIARAVQAALGSAGEVRIADASTAVEALAEAPDLLVVGGPTQRHRMSHALEAALEAIPKRNLRGVASAAFDTRYRMSPLLSGSAARQIERLLRKTGCRAVADAESFFIAMDHPPDGTKRRHELEELEPGELERAGTWAELVASRADRNAPAGRLHGR